MNWFRIDAESNWIGIDFCGSNWIKLVLYGIKLNLIDMEVIRWKWGKSFVIELLVVLDIVAFFRIMINGKFSI